MKEFTLGRSVTLREEEVIYKGFSGFTNDTLSQIETGNSCMEDQQSVITEKHSCWICQEEMGSEALLLQHYENHMSNVAKDGS